jgi:hypothetical protein
MTGKRRSTIKKTQDLIDNSPFAVPGKERGLRPTTPQDGDTYPVETPWGKVDVAALMRGSAKADQRWIELQSSRQALAQALAALEPEHPLLVALGFIAPRHAPQVAPRADEPEEIQKTYADLHAEWRKA